MEGEVRLRDVKESDLPIFYEHQRDPEAGRMAAFPSRTLERFLAHWAKVLADSSIVKKTILFDGKVAGNVVSFHQNGLPEVGYWVGKEYWGKGIATRALTDFLAWVPTRPLYAHVAIHNRGSIRVLEKCGFVAASEEETVSSVSDDGVEEILMRLDA